MILKHLGEFNFINRVSQGIKLSSRVIKGIGDDTAVLKYTKDKYQLFTCDMLIENRHFERNADPYFVGRKAVCCNISDVASMGGVPKYALISLGVPGVLDVKYTDRLYKGINSAAKKFNVDLVGGDTVHADKIIINIALLGEVEKKNLVLRSGAKEKDVIFVTGTIGGSRKGKHLNFTPRLKEARFLVENFKINSMIDISDGLGADIGHIMESSNVGAVIYEKKIPISKHAKDFRSALKDGEDFELLFTLSKKEAGRLSKQWLFKTPLTSIGEICKGKKINLKLEGYTHF